MPTYNERGEYVDEYGNPAPNPADAAPGFSQAISNFFGVPYTPGRMTGLPHDETENVEPTHAPQALSGKQSGWGTYMPIQKGVTGAATPALGIQAGTLQEDIDQEAGGVGDVWDNIMPALESGGDPFTEADNIPRPVPPPKPIPPQAAQVPEAPVPDLSDVIYDDDRTSPHEYRLGERQQRRDLRRADPDYWGMGGPGDDSIIGSIIDLFRPDPITEVYDDDFTSGTAARAARREQEKAIDADNQGVTSPPIDTPPSPTRRGPRRGPQNWRSQTEAPPPQLQAPTDDAALRGRGPRGAGQTQPQTAPSPPVEAQVVNPNPRSRIAQSSDLPQEVTLPQRKFPIRGRGPNTEEAGPSILNWIMSQLSQSPTEAAIMDNVVPQVPTRGTAPRVSPRRGGRDVRPPTASNTQVNTARRPLDTRVQRKPSQIPST